MALLAYWELPSGSNIDEPEAANLAANDDAENDTTTVPPDKCWTLEAPVVRTVSVPRLHLVLGVGANQ
jgi:hypothetical protein